MVRLQARLRVPLQVHPLAARPPVLRQVLVVLPRQALVAARAITIRLEAIIAPVRSSITWVLAIAVK